MAMAWRRRASVLLSGLNSPFGMALVGDVLYVANTDAVVRFPYPTGDTQDRRGPATKLVDLPGGPLNHHWTKNVIAIARWIEAVRRRRLQQQRRRERDGQGRGRAPRSGKWIARPARIASSRRGCAIRSAWRGSRRRGALWTAVNERDELGSDLVPDYMTSVRDGGFYGWPYSYYGQHVDKRVKPQRPDLVATAIVPDYALGPHTASLGLAYSTGNALPARFGRGMFVGAARLVESQAAQRLQGDLRAVQRRQAVGRCRSTC